MSAYEQRLAARKAASKPKHHPVGAGVAYDKTRRTNPYRARYMRDGRMHYVGTYATYEAAAAAVEAHKASSADTETGADFFVEDETPEELAVALASGEWGLTSDFDPHEGFAPEGIGWAILFFVLAVGLGIAIAKFYGMVA